jgi:hypothetical protein
MDRQGLKLECERLLATITKTSGRISEFVLGCRSARADLDRISRELHSLRTILELLSDEPTNTAVPKILEIPVASVAQACVNEVAGLASFLEARQGEDAEQWALTGKNKTEISKCNLENYKSTLELVLNIVDWYLD